MSGPKPKQQQSRSAKDGWKDPEDGTLETMTKEEVIETVKEINIDDVSDTIDTFFNEGDEEDGEYS